MLVEWLVFGVAFVGLVITIVSVSNKNASEIAVLKSDNETLKKDIRRCDEEMRLHISLNERAFSNFERDIKSINSKLDTLIGYFKAQNKLDI